MCRKTDKYIKFQNSPVETSKTNTTYYEYVIASFKKIHKLPKFPFLSSKEIYKEIVTKCQPRIEKIHQMKNWVDIWRNVNFKYINIKDRDILYKFIHEILPNNKRLYQMRIKNSPNCDHCQVDDTNMHRFYQCHKIKKAIKWFKGLIEYISNMRFYSIEKLLLLELPNIQRKVKNVMCIIICNFIACIWYNRENLEFIKEKVVAKIWKEKKFVMVLLKDKSKDILCKRYCEIDIEKLNSFNSL